jgi:hypothetical protein
MPNWLFVHHLPVKETTYWSRTMNRTPRTLARARERDLERMIEPLASYISAASQPQAVLASALAVLFTEVEATNRMAFAHVTACLESHQS